jgi:hypothetical protein
MYSDVVNKCLFELRMNRYDDSRVIALNEMLERTIALDEDTIISPHPVVSEKQLQQFEIDYENFMDRQMK